MPPGILRFGPELRARVRANLDSHPRSAAEPAGLRPAAVAVTLVPDDEGQACFLLTRRAARLRNHAGQWALPGGGVEPGESAVDAAVRELGEELGLRLDRGDALGLLDDYATRSGFVITPVVLWVSQLRDIVPDPTEVAAVHLVPLSVLERPGVPRIRRIPESDRPVISIRMVGTHVHAPTAAIVYQLREVAIHGRPTRVAHFEQPVFAWRSGGTFQCATKALVSSG
ncbi:MAG: NUDIX hydrolase [Candidatus Binatia bacterium]